jgi:hypothetical protein
MSELRGARIRITDAEYRRLTPGEQIALEDWIKSFFDCNPDHIEWIEFTVGEAIVNWSMQINLIVPENRKRPTLVSEMHLVPVTALVPEGLLRRLVEVSGVA